MNVRVIALACCALAASWGVAFAQAPSLTPEGSPLRIAPTGASVGGRPAIGFDGTGFFVAWRTSSGAIAGGRVTTAGVALDPSGIAIGTGSGPPSVAFDGTNFLVVWEDAGEIRGARVTPAGAVLDTPALALTTGADVKNRPVGIAFGDTTYLVVWRTNPDDLYAARITRGGANLDGPGGFRFGRGFYPWAAFDGTNFFIVWHDHGNGLDIFGNRISQDGSALDGSGAVLFAGDQDQDHASVAFDGTNYLVAWHDTRGGADDGLNDGSAWATRVSTGGVVLDNPAIQVADNVRGHVPVVAAFDGTNFIVAWQVDMTPAKFRLVDVFGRRIAMNGALVDPLPVPLATGYSHQFSPTIGAGDNAYFVAWNELLGDRCGFTQASEPASVCVYAQVFRQGAALPEPETGSSAPVPSSWQPVASSTSQPLYAVFGVDGTRTHAVGEGGAAVRHNGAAWQLTGGLSQRVFGLWGDRDTNVWAVGWCWSTFHYDGQTWTDQGCNGPTALGIWGVSSDHILAVGPDGSFQRYDGFNWGPGPTGVEWSLWDIWGTSATNVYATGEFGTVLQYDGAGWTTLPNIPTLQSLNSIWGSGPSDIFAVGDFGTIIHYDGVTWTLQRSGTTEHLFGVWGFSSSHAYAVGFNGTALRYDGTTWQPEMSGTTHHLLDVGIAGGDIWAVGDQGTITGKSFLALALSVSNRRDALPPGSAPQADSVDVLIAGPGAAGAGWSATHGAAATWVTLTTSAGTGSGMLQWSRDPSGLTVGTYIDTITVTVAGAVGSPAHLVNTLVVGQAPTLTVVVDAILGGSVLTPEQVEYLDLLGNYNGEFDLGDFLAYALQNPG